MRQFLFLQLMVIIIAILLNISAEAARLKDIANIRGVRENQLVGYGLVVGLKGTGDGKSEFTSKSFVRMLDTMGVKLTQTEIESKNVAAVLITANLPEFARAGNKLDVTVHSIGNASSLQGGTLVQTPLRAANQQVYAVAQGPVIVSTDASGKGQLTVGRAPDAATVERDIEAEFSGRKMLRLTLQNPDFTTAARTAQTVNADLGGKYAVAKDGGTVDVIVPPQYDGNAVELLATIESLEINPDTRAKVVINEKTGTVVIGEKVRISKVAISHGNISVSVGVSGGDRVNARGPASVTVAQTNKKEGGAHTALVGGEANVGEIVNALNGLGISPKDLITILQNIKAAGALQGELEIL